MTSTATLHWFGRNARFVLAFGCLAALFLPQLSAFIRPALPILVSMVLGIAMARLDLIDIAKNTLKPIALAQSVGLTLLIMPVTALVYVGLSRVFDLSSSDHTALVLLAAAPPIASAANLCFLLGFNARLALQTTLVATILTPVIGPVMVAYFLPDAAPISPLLLGQRLSFMIAGGLVFGAALRMSLGPQRIDRNKLSFDGIAAVGMVIFVIPLFDGVGETILESPSRALWVLALAFLFNLGANLVVSMSTRAKLGHEAAGTLGVITGNRTIAIYLAALPHDPYFALFTALYQFPMYLTPLIWARFKR